MPSILYHAERETAKRKPSQSPRSVEQCLKTKQIIVNELIAGRLELLEAASRFQAVHSTSAECSKESSVNENMCRTLIGWVHLSLCGNRPEEAERVSDRLERELQKHLDRRAKIGQSAAVC